jgi:hypothetical protein
MKYFAIVCSALLALVLVCQLLILARLKEIPRNPTVIPASSAPSVAAIASEIRKQMAREARQSSPPTFQIRPTGGAEAHGGNGESIDLASGGLQSVTLSIVREGGPAADLAVTSPTGIPSQFKKVQSGEDSDRFEVSFKPETGNFLPTTWRFSLAYVAADGKRHERSFTVAYHAGKTWPDYLEVREKNE